MASLIEQAASAALANQAAGCWAARLPTVGQSRRLRPDSIQRLNLQTFLTVLKRRVQEDSHPDDFVSLSYEQAIGNDCSLTGYGPS